MIPVKMFKTREIVEEILLEVEEYLEINSPKDFVSALIKGDFDKNFFKEENLLDDPKRRKYPKFTNPKSDFNCAIELYEALDITRDNANDTRLWTYACLKVYPRYIYDRGKHHDSLTKETLFFHYFYKGASATTSSRNTISKLWWAVKQTVDNSISDKYKYTKILIQDGTSQVFQDLTQRALIFSNKKVLRAYLLFMEKKHGETSKQISPLILNHLKSFNIHHLEEKEIVKLLENFLEDRKLKGHV